LQSRSVSDIHGSMDIGQSFEVWSKFTNWWVVVCRWHETTYRFVNFHHS
jgi:hypothetical protein